MGQDEHSKRVWDTEQERERKRAYRERKRLEQGQASEPPVPPPPVVPPVLEKTRRIPTEEEYVRQELALTKAQIEKGWIKTKDANGAGLDPLRRSEQYARWRYHGFLAGEIASL